MGLDCVKYSKRTELKWGAAVTPAYHRNPCSRGRRLVKDSGVMNGKSWGTCNGDCSCKFPLRHLGDQQVPPSRSIYCKGRLMNGEFLIQLVREGEGGKGLCLPCRKRPLPSGSSPSSLEVRAWSRSGRREIYHGTRRLPVCPGSLFIQITLRGFKPGRPDAFIIHGRIFYSQSLFLYRSFIPRPVAEL